MGYPGYVTDFVFQPQRGCACVHHFNKNHATALRLRILCSLLPRVADAATLGWRT